jgi:hypothetical protein
MGEDVPWFFTGVIMPRSLQSNLEGRLLAGEGAQATRKKRTAVQRARRVAGRMSAVWGTQDGGSKKALGVGRLTKRSFPIFGTRRLRAF